MCSTIWRTEPGLCAGARAVRWSQAGEQGPFILLWGGEEPRSEGRGLRAKPVCKNREDFQLLLCLLHSVLVAPFFQKIN